MYYSDDIARLWLFIHNDETKDNCATPLLWLYKDKTQRSNSVDQTFVMIFPKRNPSAQQESMRKCCRKIFSLIGVLPIKNKTKQALLDNAGY